jgi:hypothetical protein
VKLRSLNQTYTRLTMKRRYEVWFLKLMLADGSGAWWFRYLLMNPGRTGGGCSTDDRGMPIQLWATWFPKGDRPATFIQGFPISQAVFTKADADCFQLGFGENRIDENSCAGRILTEGHEIAWNLKYQSSFCASLSDVAWVGFSRTPHSDATFSGKITFDGRTFSGQPVGYGLQGHNCGYRHRKIWTWTHCLAMNENGDTTSFEALEYEIGLGMYFRKALLWHENRLYSFKQFTDEGRDPVAMRWRFKCADGRGAALRANIDGSGPSLHRLPYLKTDCSETFEVSNNSLAVGTLRLKVEGRPESEILANGGAVLEMAG